MVSVEGYTASMHVDALRGMLRCVTGGATPAIADGQETHMTPQPTDEPSRHVWVVRAGRNAAYASEFLNGGRVAIGFDVHESVEGSTWEELSGKVGKTMTDASPVAVGLAVGALFRLANDFEVGDYVLTPETGGNILAGEITGPYEFDPAPASEDYSHTRPVRWFARIPRSSLSEDMRRTLGSIMTLFKPGLQGELIERLDALKDAPAPGPSPVVINEAQGVVAPGIRALPETMIDPPLPGGGQFEPGVPALMYLLSQIENRDLALPDFQRSFVWEPSGTRELIVSIMRVFLAGNLLFLRGGSTVFLPRSVEGAPALDGHEPATLVLDGQQRLSSLFQAFYGVGSHRFFVDVGTLMQGADVETAVKVYSTAKARQWSTPAGQARSLMFPLARIQQFAGWRDEIVEARDDLDPDEGKALRGYLNLIESAIIEPIRRYQFPTTTLSESTPTEAVCTIFETLNRTGIKLSVFELISARAFAQGERLRERWSDTLERNPVLEDFGIDPYYILQAIALRAGLVPRRGVVAAMEVSTIVQHWDAAVSGMANGLTMIRDECGVLMPKWLPYAPMLPTLAAAWQSVQEAQGAASGARRLKLQRWFWCATFAGDYDNAPNSRADADMPLLRNWLRGGDQPPVVRDFEFDPSQWAIVTIRQRALYRATMALLLRHRPLDFHEAVPLTRTVIDSTAVDDHHVFPKGYLSDVGLGNRIDSVLNHTLIDRETNIRIQKKAPSVYLTEIADELPNELPRILNSHGLPDDKEGPLWRNNFDGFLEWRLQYLAQELEKVT